MTGHDCGATYGDAIIHLVDFASSQPERFMGTIFPLVIFGLIAIIIAALLVHRILSDPLKSQALEFAKRSGMTPKKPKKPKK